MPKRHAPRKGSMQYWPHSRAKRTYASVKKRTESKDAKPLEFAGYKAGMTHILVKDNSKNSITKGMTVSVPVTVIECPQMKIAGVRFYKLSGYGTAAKKDFLNPKLDKELGRKISLPKEHKDISVAIDAFDKSDVVDMRVLVYTEPKKAGIGKKKPEIFEMAVGGDLNSKIAFVKSHFESGLSINDCFKAGQFVDVHAITKAHGTQGPVKRFKVEIRHHKSEKGKRLAGTLGPWRAQGHIMYRVPAAGKDGFHTRVDYNKKIMMISDKVADVNPDGGFVSYGLVKSSFVLVKGSVPGGRKRLIRLVASIRSDKKADTSAPVIAKVTTTSKQGAN